MFRDQQHQTECDPHALGDLHYPISQTEDAFCSFPLLDETSFCDPQEANALASDLNSLCNNLSFQDIMEETGFDVDSDSLDSLVDSFFRETTETQRFELSDPPPLENSWQSPVMEPAATDLQEGFRCQSKRYHHVCNYTTTLTSTVSTQSGATPSLTSNSHWQPDETLPLQWPGNNDTETHKTQRRTNSHNGCRIPGMTTIIDPWTTNDQYSEGSDISNPFDLVQTSYAYSNMTSAQESLLEEPNRRPGQHRSSRVYLPEGEQKLNHIRKLANIRAKEHNARKKNERLTLQGELQREEKRNQLLLQQQQQLLQERHMWIAKMKLQRNPNQSTSITAQNDAAVSQW
ncbi:uncharacterized protein LOC135199802 [Macrobrachium nipponense]|uniref:uncharacterized protein LOC135199802 n=1 Tax=Macrobrachium nipponense TaxID=159736 RepID=UPI0030C86ED1